MRGDVRNALARVEHITHLVSNLRKLFTFAQFRQSTCTCRAREIERARAVNFFQPKVRIVEFVGHGSLRWYRADPRSAGDQKEDSRGGATHADNGAVAGAGVQ